MHTAGTSTEQNLVRLFSIYNAGHGFHDLCSVIFHTEETKIKNIAQKT
jgi:hypothetical protein